MTTIYYSRARQRALQKVDEPRTGSWVVAIAPDKTELDILAEQYGLDRDNLEDAVDIYEAPRIEVENGVVYIYTRYCFPEGKEIATEPLSFDAPTKPDLSAQADGFGFQTDPATTYHVYGDNARTIRDQIQRCAPRAGGTAAEFTAETSYSLGWDYSIVNGANSCSLSNVKVGMRTATALPFWQAGPTAASGLAGRWQNFMQGLTVHENGHVALDKTYGQQLYNDLNSMTNVDCANISGLAKAVATSDVAVLNQANENYDDLTRHGATQGAVLPTD